MTAVKVHLERTIPAPPSKVYRAWLDPDLLIRWMAPVGFDVIRVEVDERVGGHYRIWHGAQGTEAGGFDAELLELVPDERISFRWGFVGPERREGPAYDSTLTVTLRAEPGGGTKLTLVHEHLDELHEAMPEVAENVAPGWEQALDALTTTVTHPTVTDSTRGSF